jgi:hypothetical protein
MITGAAVWFSGYLYRDKSIQSYANTAWYALALSLIILSLMTNSLYFLIPYSVALIAFWLLFNHLTSIIQHRCPSVHIAGVFSARTVQLIGVSILGEYFVAAMAPHWSVTLEISWRAALCLVVALFLSKRGFRIDLPS